MTQAPGAQHILEQKRDTKTLWQDPTLTPCRWPRGHSSPRTVMEISVIGLRLWRVSYLSLWVDVKTRHPQSNSLGPNVQDKTRLKPLKMISGAFLALKISDFPLTYLTKFCQKRCVIVVRFYKSFLLHGVWSGENSFKALSQMPRFVFVEGVAKRRPGCYK